jgi:hypothetical protein
MTRPRPRGFRGQQLLRSDQPRSTAPVDKTRAELMEQHRRLTLLADRRSVIDAANLVTTTYEAERKQLDGTPIFTPNIRRIDRSIKRFTTEANKELRRIDIGRALAAWSWLRNEGTTKIWVWQTRRRTQRHARRRMAEYLEETENRQNHPCGTGETRPSTSPATVPWSYGRVGDNFVYVLKGRPDGPPRGHRVMGPQVPGNVHPAVDGPHRSRTPIRTRRLPVDQWRCPPRY